MSGKMRFTSILALLALLCGLAFAQTETGAILGTVTDPQGAVVAGAKVTVVNTATSQERSTMTNSNGLYSVTNLQPGDYTVKVEAANFQATTKRLNVSVGSRNTIDFPLTVSGGTQTVEVVGEGGVAVETQTQTLSSVISGQQLSELPTRDRNPYSLVDTAGNVSTNTPGRGAGVAINGQRDASTDVLLDGGENVDLFVSGVGQSTPLDSVSEFRVITSNFTAEYGRASGGIVNVTTKSGTNNFHGSVFEYYRGAGLTSNSYDNNASMTNDIQLGNCTGVSDPTCSGQKPNYVRNQFGYSVGGPVMKDKLFFFSSTEWVRVRSQGTVNAWVLDPTFIGNCSNFANSGNVGDSDAAACARVQDFYSTYGTLKPGLKILSGPTDIGGGCTLANGTGVLCPGVASGLGTNPLYDQVQYSVPSDSGGGSPENGYSNVERVDFNWTDKTQMYWRYALQSDDFFPGSVSNNAYVGYDTGTTVFNNNFLWNVTHIWGPNVVTQSKFVFNRLNTVQPLNGPGVPTLDWRSSRGVFHGGVPLFGPGYLPNQPGNGLPFGGPQNLYQFYQDVSWTKGKHQFRFGGQYIHTRDNRVFGAYETAVLGLNTSSSISTANQFLTHGVQRQFQTAVDPQGKLPCPTDPFGATISTPSCQVTVPVTQPRFDRANRYHDFAFYAEDSWRVHPRLTLNLGVRWEYYGVQHNNDPSFDSNFYLGPGTNFYQQTRNGTSMTVTNPANPVGGLWTPDYNNWAPRIGFAWDIFGDGKTALRGGYGIGYERNFGNVTFNVIQNPPSYLVVSSFAGDVGCENGCPIDVNNLGPLGVPGPPKDLPKASLRSPIQNMQTAYAHIWSLALERQIMKDTVVALEYSGSKGVKEYTIENFNRQAAGPLFLGDNPLDQLDSNGLPVRKLNDTFSGINQRGQLGYSNYNALNVRVQTNNIHNTGLSFVSNYTWSHGLDNTSSTFSEFGNDFNLGLLNPAIPREDYGDQNFDIRHRWIFSSTWDSPWFKNDSSWWKKEILGGWTVAPQFNIQSGGPFSFWDCTEAAFNVCPRWFNGAVLNSAAHDVSTPEGNSCINGNNDCGGVNTWDYLTFDPATQYFASPFGYFNPVAGTSEWGVCGVGEGAVNGCPFPANMTRRNSFRTPGFWTVNMGLYKTFDITERWKLQLKAESFNLFNHSNLYVDGGSAEADNTQVPYILQLFGIAPTGCFTVADCPAAVTAVRGGHGDVNVDRRTVQLTVKVIF